MDPWMLEPGEIRPHGRALVITIIAYLTVAVVVIAIMILAG